MATTSEPSSLELGVERSLQSKYVSSPWTLSAELKTLLGPGQYKVEMRQNVYTIRSSKDFDLVKIVPLLGLNH